MSGARLFIGDLCDLDGVLMREIRWWYVRKDGRPNKQRPSLGIWGYVKDYADAQRVIESQGEAS